MGYFPFFMDIKEKMVVVIGGGTVALRKIEKLLPFETSIRVIAPEICEKISQISNVEKLQRCFRDSDIDGAFAVIGASDDTALNAHIAMLCRERNIPVNIVDDPEKCTFYFPSLVKENDITIGISTSGTSPLFAKFLRKQIEDMLDEFQLGIAEILGRYRPVIRQMFASEQHRKEAAYAILDFCLIDDTWPEDAEINALLERIKAAYEAQNRNEKK